MCDVVTREKSCFNSFNCRFTSRNIFSCVCIDLIENYCSVFQLIIWYDTEVKSPGSTI